MRGQRNVSSKYLQEKKRGKEPHCIIQRFKRHRLTANSMPSLFNINAKVSVNGVANTC